MDSIFYDLFVPGVPVVEKIARSVIVYVFLVAALRLAGKRELAQMNTVDLVVLLLLSNTVQNAIIGNDNSLVGGVVGASTLLLINYLTVRFLFHHETLGRVVEGTAVLLIDKGRLVQRNLERVMITEQELRTACHRQGIERIEEVEKAILETSGTISIFTRHPTQSERFAADVDRRLAAIESLLTTRDPSGRRPPAS